MEMVGFLQPISQLSKKFVSNRGRGASALFPPLRFPRQLPSFGIEAVVASGGGR